MIGAGPGGLASAMMLAGAGLKVTVYEKNDTVGGRTRVFAQDGFRFDVGATFFLYPDVLKRVFARCGLALEDYVDLRRVDPQYRLVFAGGPEVLATYDIDRLETEIAKLDPVDARELRRFLERGRRKLAAFKPVLERPFSRYRDFASLPILKALRWLKPFTSVNDDLATHFRDPRVRLAFSFQTKYLGMSPFRCPSLFTILALLEYEFGVWHPMGGCGAVSEAMGKAARDIGVTFKMGEPVTAIAFEGKRAVGVTSAGGFQSADAVVVNADFAGTIAKLVPDKLRKHWPDARIERAKYSCSTFMLYLGIEGRYDHLDHHTIFLSKDYEGNIRRDRGRADPHRSIDLPAEPLRDRSAIRRCRAIFPVRACARRKPCRRCRLDQRGRGVPHADHREAGGARPHRSRQAHPVLAHDDAAGLAGRRAALRRHLQSQPRA